MGYIYLAFSMSISGFVFSFFRGWLLTLIIICIIPILMLTTYLVTRTMRSGYSESQQAFTKSFAHAEQAFHNILIV